MGSDVELVPRYEAVNLVTLVTNVSSRLPLEHALELRFEGDPTLAVDPLLIGRMFAHLIVDADRRAVHQPVRVDIAAGDDGITVHVTNDGRGIPPDGALRLFEPEPLAFCRLVCEAHAGKLWLECGDAGRVTFAFGLPRARP